MECVAKKAFLKFDLALYGELVLESADLSATFPFVWLVITIGSSVS